MSKVTFIMTFILEYFEKHCGNVILNSDNINTYQQEALIGKKMFWSKIDGIVGEVIPMCIKKNIIILWL